MKYQRLKSIAVQVHLAERVRKRLIKEGALLKGYKIKKDNDYVYFPVKKSTTLPKGVDKYSVVNKAFEKKEQHICSYKELVSLPEELKQELPTSYDVIGQILLIKLPQSLQHHKKRIGEALLQADTHIKTVCVIDPVRGELRTRTIDVVAGEQKTTTIHREYGLEFCVDVQKTYFSSRLASERKRVASLVQPGETVVDMFAGVAPFSIMIARYANPKIIYAVDKNREAIKLAKTNVRKNKVLDKIETIHGDAKDVRTLIPCKADRVIMNLPFSAFHFLPYALTQIEEKGVLHYYDILSEGMLTERIDEIKTIGRQNNIKLTTSRVRKIKTYAPREFYIGMDITATTMPM